MRKEPGLELTDRIVVTLPTADADLLEPTPSGSRHETLAVSLETDGVRAALEKVDPARRTD